MPILQNKIILLLTFSLACLLAPAGLLAQDAAKTVAILPFQLNAPPDKQYLADGFQDMLGSRLRTEAGASILAKNKVQAAVQAEGGQPVPGNMNAIARTTAADYLVYGTITALGGGISIDAKVYAAEIGEGNAIQEFYSAATTSDRIMFAIDTLSWDILEKYFGKKRPASLAPVVTAQAPLQESKPTFTSAHPDKTFMSSGGGFGLSGGRNFMKTRNFAMDLRGFDIGDVDGDGKAEIIIADKSEVKVFRRDGTRLNKLATIKMLVRAPVHSVNTADLNGNGRAEIYISASDPDFPGSSAVEWDGQKFVDLFRDVRWYIRPIEVPGLGLVLAGQAAGMLAVEPGIYVLSVVDGKFHIQQRLPVPKDINLFDFVYANLDGTGKHELVALDSSFKLRVIQNGTTVWKSDERFAGTKRFIGGEPTMRRESNPFANDEVDAVGERFKRIFLPSRILVTDVDNDGADDIIINRNPESLSTVAQNLIQYPSGTLVGLKWNGIGLEELWRTKKIGGYVVDYQVKSLALPSVSPQENELFVGMILDSGSLNPLASEQTTVVIYPFEFEQPESK